MKKVYLLANIDKGRYKIGVTKGDVQKRIKGLQTGNPEEITVITEFQTEYHTKIESTLHRRFQSKRLKGEWFELTDDDVNNFITECKKLNDNFEAMKNMDNPFI